MSQRPQPSRWKVDDPPRNVVVRIWFRLARQTADFGHIAGWPLGWLEINDVDAEQTKEQFAKRLNQLLGDPCRPFTALPLLDDKTVPSVALMRALLLSYGHDFISGLSERGQRRQWQQLEAEFGIGRRNVADLRNHHRRTLKDLQREPCFPIRHGAPRALKEAGLVAVP